MIRKKADVEKKVHVAAAIIEKDGKIFAAQRSYGDGAIEESEKDWWEFPGGKIEKDETAEEAVVREIFEELGATIEVGEKLTTVEHDYLTFHLTMECFLCHLSGGVMTLKEHEAARWLSLDELEDVRWLPADLKVVRSIQTRYKTGK